MKFDDLNEELNEDVQVTVDNEGFAELTDIYHDLESPSHEDVSRELNTSSLKEQLLLLTKIHEQSGVLEADIPNDMSQKILDLVEGFQIKFESETPNNIEQDVEVLATDELVKNSEYLKEKRDFARQYVNKSDGKLHPNTKNHIDAYLKKHTGNCSDNFVTVTRIGPTPITSEQRKANEEAEVQRQKAEAVNQIAKISRFLLEQAENGKISFALPTDLSVPPLPLPQPTVKEKVLGKWNGLKFKFKKVKKELFFSAVSCVQKALNVE